MKEYKRYWQSFLTYLLLSLLSSSGIMPISIAQAIDLNIASYNEASWMYIAIGVVLGVLLIFRAIRTVVISLALALIAFYAVYYIYNTWLSLSWEMN